jgi:hypothetical protein
MRLLHLLVAVRFSFCPFPLGAKTLIEIGISWCNIDISVMTNHLLKRCEISVVHKLSVFYSAAVGNVS